MLLLLLLINEFFFSLHALRALLPHRHTDDGTDYRHSYSESARRSIVATDRQTDRQTDAGAD